MVPDGPVLRPVAAHAMMGTVLHALRSGHSGYRRQVTESLLPANWFAQGDLDLQVKDFAAMIVDEHIWNGW